MRFYIYRLFFIICLLRGIIVNAQTGVVSGYLKDADTDKGIPNLTFTLGKVYTLITDETGFFRLPDLPYGHYSIEIAEDHYEPLTREFTLESPTKDLGIIYLLNTQEIALPTLTLEQEDLENDQSVLNAGLLTASQDIFVRQAGRNFSAAFFNLRGYGSEDLLMHMNGACVNELLDGEASWNAWTGLNDVTRNQYSVDGLTPVGFSFGDIGGSSRIDSRAGSQRAGTRLGYALSNRTYRHRIMLTHSTGWTKKNWAFSVSGSRRWGKEGFVEGTFYDGYSYFASLEKRLGSFHRITVTGLGAPTKRGQAGPTTQEAYDLAGNNNYNPYWGYQNGKKRNSRIVNNHIPLFILSHSYNKKSTVINSAVSYQFGKSGRQMLDWVNAADPRPDYYRYLPSYYALTDTASVNNIAHYLQSHPNAMQINWDKLYEANSLNSQSVENANGIAGNTITGKRAQYLVNETHTDPKILGLFTNFEHYFNGHISTNGGLALQNQQTAYYNEVYDLLGADYFLDINRFAERDFPEADSLAYSDTNTPNKIAYTGDHYGHDYTLNDRKMEGWVQGLFIYKRIDFFLAGLLGYKSYFRDGKYKNGLFPDNSMGKSVTSNHFNYATKGGLTYKINGRNFLVAMVGYTSRAPFSQNVFISPRTRNELVPNLVNEKLIAKEAGYLLKAPNVKGRIMVFHTDINDQIKNKSVYLDAERVFGNVILSNIDERHQGVEAAAEVKIIPGLFLHAVASIGDYYYTSRPEMRITQDNSAALLQETTVYQKNYFVPGSPQRVYSGGIRYEGKQFWFVNLTGSVYDGIYSDFSPLRRTAAAVDNVSPDSELWNSILDQTKTDPQFMLDIFAGKSFRIRHFVRTKPLFINFNIGVNNILGNRELISSFFEQTRFDIENKNPDKFPPKIYYAIGRNYFINLTFRY